jgi:hypothetical protein
MNHPFTRPRQRTWLHFEQKCRFNCQTTEVLGQPRMSTIATAPGLIIQGVNP